MQNKARKNGCDDYSKLRGSLLHRGYTLRSFAHEYGYAYTSVVAAARRDRAGVVTVKIRKHLEEVAYV